MNVTLSKEGDPLHLGVYPAYSGLWHLDQLKVLEVGPDGGKAPMGQAEDLESSPKVRVALIDTPVAWQHPCLKNAIIAPLMIDFAAEQAGAFVVADDPQGLRTVFQDDAILNGHINMPWKDDAQALRNRLVTPVRPAHLGQAAASSSHGAHGTAMAGLIGARPAHIRVHDPSHRSPTAKDAATLEVVLPYCGLNPFCEIVPISTSADPEPHEMIQALLYADFIRADLIVLAVSLPVPDEAVERQNSAAVKTLESQTDSRRILDALLCDLGTRVPIFCAAGNHGGKVPSYPARLASEGNAIVAVGAHNALGFPCVYGPTGPGVTVYAPSGDDERVARGADGGYDVRLDRWQRRLNRGDDAGLFIHATTDADVVPPECIVTTDVPGPFGYNPSTILRASYSTDGPDGAVEVFLDPAHLLGLFSGTSAATAIAAGFAALAMTAGKISRPRTPGFKPDEIKRKLVAVEPVPDTDKPALNRLVWP